MRRARSQRGTSESVQWAIFTPLLLLVIVGAIQSGIWLHGRILVQEAAAAGADTLASTTGSPAAARAVVQRMSGDLRDVQIAITEERGSVTVAVDARTQTFLDLGQGRVSASVTQPKERR